ncbi:ATP-binding protein [Streptosporangium sp. NPDC050855]|uniref:ATP-binding protein n=1 Tax=Streptosporangium sp. NPDC050855 TaxID=3366194 RepID=UPI00379D8362
MSAMTVHRGNFPGRTETVAAARRFVADLVDGLPCAADIVLCVSELASNAILHSASGEIGGTFDVLVDLDPPGRPGAVALAVVDQGSPQVPRPRRPAEESGRGLALITTLADEIDRTGTTTTALFTKDKEAG